MVVSVHIRWKKDLDAKGAVQTTWLQPESFSLNWTPSWRMALWKTQQYIRYFWLPRQNMYISSLDVKPSKTLRVTDMFLFLNFSPLFKNIFYIFCLTSESSCWEKVGYGTEGKERRWRSNTNYSFKFNFYFSLTKVEEKWLKQSTFLAFICRKKFALKFLSYQHAVERKASRNRFGNI